MTRKERYRTDPEYRAKVNAENRARYQRQMANPVYAKLVATWTRIGNARMQIAHHERKLAFFHNRIQSDLKSLAKWKLRWKDEKRKMRTRRKGA